MTTLSIPAMIWFGLSLLALALVWRNRTDAAGRLAGLALHRLNGPRHTAVAAALRTQNILLAIETLSVVAGLAGLLIPPAPLPAPPLDGGALVQLGRFVVTYCLLAVQVLLVALSIHTARTRTAVLRAIDANERAGAARLAAYQSGAGIVAPGVSGVSVEAR